MMTKSVWRACCAIPMAWVLLIGASGCESDPPSNIRVQCPSGTVERGDDCVVPASVEVGPSTIGPARLGRPFVTQFEAVGGAPPYAYTAEGALPDGLTLSGSGELAGTPERAGLFAFEVQAEDQAGLQGTVAVELEVQEIDCVPSDEVCDGIDNDCDGNIDEEDPQLGEACGDDDACQPGSIVCVAGALVCEGALAPSEEVCDGVDNDCNGAIDDGVLNACGECGDLPEEICDGIDNNCDGQTDEGVLNECGQCGEVGEEVCDGQDNDCDGNIDEGLLNACGECGDVPEELCDGQDNNCDGVVDEGCPCESGERERCGTDVGLCEFGERLCVNGLWGECEGGQNSAPEVCDGLDNNCDGQNDENVLNACGQCGDVPEEVCDGQDNDCDGDTDENVLNACGQCGDVPTEVCDGIDNDCDGQTDENLTATLFVDADSDGFGTDETVVACPGTPRTAVQDGDCNDDNGAINPGAQEICGNGLDDNCNNQIDESQTRFFQDEDSDGFGNPNNAQTACEQPDGFVPNGDDCNDANSAINPDAIEVCDGVDNNCNANTDEGVLNACGECGPVPVEVCDGQDNDCDGDVDNNPQDTGEPCGDGPNVCSPGRTTCEQGQLVCEGVDEGSPEICDGVDNDCDGVIDNDPEGVGDECGAERCGFGQTVCTDGSVVCGVEPLIPATQQVVALDSPFVRALTGTQDPFISDNGDSYSVLITSDGERIYNVAYGIDGVSYAGWTIKTYVPDQDGLLLQEEQTIRVDWDDTGAPRSGFAGVAADGQRIWATNVASANFPGAVWTIDLEEGTADVELFWDGRNTFESPAEYDWVQDVFYTIQLNAERPVVFRYPGSGIDPIDEEARFRVEAPNIGALGTIASDGANLYAGRYTNAQNPGAGIIYKFGSGLANTSPGGNIVPFAQVELSASLTYHQDGFLYLPDHSELGLVRRIAATVGGSDEVCNGLDDNCDGIADEGDVCDGAELDLAVSEVGAVDNGQDDRAFRLFYTVTNLGVTDAGGRVDRFFLFDDDDPDAEAVLIGERQRGPIAGFTAEQYVETLTIPDDVPPGQKTLFVVADDDETLEDIDRDNNVGEVSFDYDPPIDCDEDRFEPNDDVDEAPEIGRFSRENNLSMCPFDEDWYAFEVPNNRNQSVLLSFRHSQGNLDMYIYDEEGDLVASSTDEDDSEFIRFRNSSGDEQLYFIQVVQEGTNNEVDYSLTLGTL